MYFGNSKSTSKKSLKVSIIDILKEEIKWNHIKYSIKTREGRKKREKKKHKISSRIRTQLQTW